MSNIKLEWGPSTAISITLASLAHSLTDGRQSASIDNSSNKYVEASVQVQAKLQSGTPSGDKTIYIYAYSSEDGTKFPDGITGSDAAITLKDPPNFKLIGEIYCPNSGGLTYVSRSMSVSKAFDWIMPRKWGIVVLNNTNVALSATGGDHAATFSGAYFTNS